MLINRPILVNKSACSNVVTDAMENKIQLLCHGKLFHKC
jgi:hypothetical protein